MQTILWLQSMRGPWMDALMLTISALGSVPAAMVILTLYYWLEDRRRGWHLMIVFLVFMQGGVIIKDLTQAGRPFEMEEEVMLVGPRPLTRGFPSAHAQSAIMLAGYPALVRFGPATAALAVAGAGAVGVSRLYMGAHYPADVAAGWAMGALGLLFLRLLLALDRRRSGFLGGWDARFFWSLMGAGLAAWQPSAESLLAGAGLCAACLLTGAERRLIGFENPPHRPARLFRLVVALVPPALVLPLSFRLASLPDWIRLQMLFLLAAWALMAGPYLFKKLKL